MSHPLPSHMEQELQALGVIRKRPVHVPVPDYVPWKPAYKGEEPPF